ncbi:MAG TPA: DUF2242 domain-containing protein [Trinickia sp.]|nr:DUF2242 domain-containing protein [Trinickia sp.]
MNRNMQNQYHPSPFRVALPSSAAAVLCLLAACSSSPPKPQQEFFDAGASPFSRNFNASSSDACEAARRALLNQGYLTNETHPDIIDASRDFQPNNDKHITVEFHVVCTQGDDPETSVVYANAVQSGYTLKKVDTSATVGFSVLGSLSLPIRSNSDSMVKVSSETIQSQPFYSQFFDYVRRYLRTSPKPAPVPRTSITTTLLPGEPPRANLPVAGTQTIPAILPPAATTPAPAASATAAAATAASATPAAPATPSLPAPLVGPTTPASVQPAKSVAPAAVMPPAAAQ